MEEKGQRWGEKSSYDSLRVRLGLLAKPYESSAIFNRKAFSVPHCHQGNPTLQAVLDTKLLVIPMEASPLTLVRPSIKLRAR